MKKLLKIIFVGMLVVLLFVGCQKDEIRQKAIEEVKSQYVLFDKTGLGLDIKEIKDHGQTGRGTVRCFYIDVNRKNYIDHWCVYIDVLKDGSIWQIDADKWVEEK